MKAIYWLQVAWKDVSTDTIVHCFQKYNSTCYDNEINEIFATLLNQLRHDDNITVEDFITFDDNITTTLGQINTDLVDCREKA